jgi:alanine racemase
VLRLTVDEQAWRTRVDALRAAVPALVPVVKGNGYGFGRVPLAQLAASWRPDEIAVGTVHELADVCAVVATDGMSIVSLTPAIHLPDTVPERAVLTVGNLEHVEVIRRGRVTGRVEVKLESSMHRHGTSAAGLAAVLEGLAAGNLDVHEFVLHLPLVSPSFTVERALDEVEQWLPQLDPAIPLSLSHIPAESFRALVDSHANRSFRLRAGTALWHGDKSGLRLSADVLDVRPIDAGQPVGYHQGPASTSGHLVMIGAGSAHGVVPLDGGLSPFHHAQVRLPLVEAPHMHTSMVLVPGRTPLPAVGEWVDVQRPLTSVAADAVEWR